VVSPLGRMENASRRRVLSAGLAGTTLALAGWRSAGATTPPTPADSAATTTPPTPPDRPTDADIEILAALQGFELAARDLYQAALDAGVSDEAGVIATLRSNHEAYANGVSGLIGGAAPQARNDQVFEQFVNDFDTDDLAAVATAGYTLESSLVATHLSALNQIEGVDGAAVMASILMVESRHVAVLADVGGQGDNLDVLLDLEGTSS
jgi:Ferritin-like domain